MINDKTEKRLLFEYKAGAFHVTYQGFIGDSMPLFGQEVVGQSSREYKNFIQAVTADLRRANIEEVKIQFADNFPQTERVGLETICQQACDINMLTSGLQEIQSLVSLVPQGVSSERVSGQYQNSPAPATPDRTGTPYVFPDGNAVR